MNDRHTRLFDRATHILDGLRTGNGTAILWHLALRGHAGAMLWLAGEMERQRLPAAKGPMSNPFSMIGLQYRAWRTGELTAAQNIALDCFNRGDLAGYRRWVHRAARAGDAEAVLELKRFEIRKPWLPERKLRRLRPQREVEW